MDCKSLGKFITRRLLEIKDSKAALAKLRRGVGKEIGEMPELLEYVFCAEENTSKEVGEVDVAVYTALTLYALHQQGTEKFMSADGKDKYSSFGSAIRKLVTKDNEMAIKRRFDKVLTASNLTELSVHARGLINLLRNAGIPFDYSNFTIDLLRFQNSDNRRNVIVEWGKAYYMRKREED